MRAQIVLCRSKRCGTQRETGDDSDGGEPTLLPPCPCRYKFKICLSSSTTEVLQQGVHIMDRNDPPTPVERQLTTAMKEYIEASLSSGEKTTAARLYSCLCMLVNDNVMAGPPPKDTQVTDFVKNWRRVNPKNSMAPMIELCDGKLYDQQDLDTLSDMEMVILCDVQPDSRSGATGSVSHLGDGSEAYPLRVGMTCLRMIRNYAAVQSQTDCTTIFHIDSTHGMAINGYLVFAFGYSDRCGHFFPMAFFCTSQKRAIDIGWCIRYICRVCMDVCGVQFSPQFVMMDADKAQFNACVSELPHTSVLMCWFHVMKNVWTHAQKKGVNVEETRAVFADLYDMHYASEQEFLAVKQRVLARWDGLRSGSPVRKLTDHLKKMWINSRRFSSWQAFHTPSGYAATNNPLEQYHRKVKLQCPDGPANPSELIKNLDGARLAFLNSETQFSTVCSASDRLLKLYRLLYSHECLSVCRIPPVGNLAADLYRVMQRPLQLTAAERKELLHSVRSVNARRMQTDNMPEGGWVVDTRSKACTCAYSRKHGMCCHIVTACIQSGTHCPGVSSRSRVFVRPGHGHGRVPATASPSPSDSSSSDFVPSEHDRPRPTDAAASPSSAGSADVDTFVDAVLSNRPARSIPIAEILSGHLSPERPDLPSISAASITTSSDLSQRLPEEMAAGSANPNDSAESSASASIALRAINDPREAAQPRRSTRRRTPTARAVASRQQSKRRRQT